MLENNSKIGWSPDHIQDGRFGNFLESNVDWALSRERYWGTPLPIWVCDQTGRMEAMASYEEVLSKPGLQGTEVWDEAKAANPELVDDLTCTQTLHRRVNVFFTVRRRWTNETRDGSH